MLVALTLAAMIAFAAPVAAARPAQYPPGSTVPGTTAPSATTTTDGSGALGENAQQSGASAGQVGSSGLARTGFDVKPFLFVGVGLVLVGAFAVISSPRLRRRSRSA